jgi:excisionase family DNA binding protein
MATKAVYQSRDKETAKIQELYKVFLLEKTPALIGPNQESIPLPESIYNILLEVLDYLRQGKGVSVIPVMQELTTQQSANLLGVSRPFLIDLLKREEIPFHKTGSHRRIYRRDVMNYLAKRDKQRNRILGELARRAVEEGDYDQMYVPGRGE